jgi:FtsH-binding integral membrane protein
MDLLKTVTAKVVAGAVALAVVAAGISWWQMDQSTRETLYTGAGRIVSWLLVVLLAPWATFFVTTWVAKRESNAAGAALVATYTLLEAVLLAWLFEFNVPGVTAWTFIGAATLFAGVYNLLVCDWIAEKLVS